MRGGRYFSSSHYDKYPDRGRGGHERGKSGFRGIGGGRGRGSRHPPGLTGKEIGLFYAARGRKKRLEREMNERPVVRISNHHRENIESLLADRISERNGASGSGTSQDREERIKRPTLEPTNEEESFAKSLERSVDLDKALKADLDYTRKVNKQYLKLKEIREKLPSFKAREKVIEYVKSNQVILISGETGCGKTTQVPQFILDDSVDSGAGSLCHIICTQPRRISATSVAERVASERGEQCGGGSCGYQIRLESSLPRPQGSILYCTTGVLLRKMIKDPLLKSASHLILDEVHERDLLSDFMLIIVKDILPLRPDLKLILMSATLNADVFSTYFNRCPRLHIPGYTFPVKELYLEDVIEALRYEPPLTQRSGFCRTRTYGKAAVSRRRKELEEEILKHNIALDLGDRYSENTVAAIHRMSFDSVDPILIRELIKYICLHHKIGGIIVFLPGWEDISRVDEAITKSEFFSKDKFLVTPLHSMMPSANQKQVFGSPPDGVWKIIIATNIAETSITINDVIYVIDGGRCKEKGYDSKLHMTCLTNVPISKASARQRAGRAGRVQPGICFHLFTKYHHSLLEEFQLPEMLRAPVEDLCLQVKVLNLGKIEDFLSKAIQPPDRESIRNAILSLQQLNAMDKNENLTPLGRHIASLPIDANIGKLILFGAIFSCLDPILTIASSLGFKSPFITPLHKEKQVDMAKRKLAGTSVSDHIMLTRAFQGWEISKQEGPHAEKDFCWDNFLSPSILNMINSMKTQFAHLLYDIGFIHKRNPKDQKANIHSSNTKLIKAILCAGLYPNVAEVETTMSRKRPPKIKTLQGRVYLHFSSVNCMEKHFRTKWLIYHKIMKTTKVYLYDTTMVSPFSLLFFGGNVTTGMDGEHELIKIDSWIKFHATAEIAKLVEKLKRELDDLLDEKAKNPSQDLTHSDVAPLLNAIVDLITKEEIHTLE